MTEGGVLQSDSCLQLLFCHTYSWLQSG